MIHKTKTAVTKNDVFVETILLTNKLITWHRHDIFYKNIFK